MHTHDPTDPAPSAINLPPIPLSDLPEATKDFLMAYAGAGKTLPESVTEILNAQASGCGFTTPSAS